ncbi:MAG: radical SAM protein [Deltaproteobacteria bacterium]|nr:MAG: radical SAM protein [Deltaproteobacteria bacterium]
MASGAVICSLSLRDDGPEGFKMSKAIPADVGASWLIHLGCCESCPRRCRVNRLAGEVGFCRVDAGIPVAHVGLHFGEEPPISGTRGSGTIFLAGCNLRCVFCQNSQISQETPPERFRRLAPAELAAQMRRLQDQGAHNINFVSPSHMVFQVAEAIEHARQAGLVVPVVYNSNGYDSVAALRRIRGLVDIYLPDLKYLDNALGKRFSGVDDYADRAPAVLREMLDQVGCLSLDEDGIAMRGVLVRHLVLPGCTDNSRRCLDFLARLAPNIPVSIMAQYAPRHRAGDYPQINRRLSQDEYDQIVDHALDLGLENAFIQELEASEHYLPDFTSDDPFGNAAPDFA